MRLAAFALLLTAAAAQAAPPSTPQAGRYQFPGKFTVLTRLRFETVVAMNEAGRSELEKLRSAGYECNYQGREIYLCKMALPAEGAEESISAFLKQNIQGKDLIFGQMGGAVTPITEGEDYSEYSVPQSLTFQSQTWENYRLARVKDTWSARFGDAASPAYLQLDLLDDGNLGLLRELTLPESKTAYSRYWVEAIFRRM